jgi:hypothetical protein
MALKNQRIDCIYDSRRDFFVFFQGIGAALAIHTKLTK